MPKATKNPMMCPDCGVKMNHHAEKLDLTRILREPKAADPDLGAILNEVHTCPECGKAAMRRAS